MLKCYKCLSDAVLLPEGVLPPMGEAKVEPMDIELVEGGFERLLKAKSTRLKPYPIKGDLRALLQTNY